jgi:hypothetical protein
VGVQACTWGAARRAVESGNLQDEAWHRRQQPGACSACQAQERRCTSAWALPGAHTLMTWPSEAEECAPALAAVASVVRTRLVHARLLRLLQEARGWRARAQARQSSRSTGPRVNCTARRRWSLRPAGRGQDDPVWSTCKGWWTRRVASRLDRVESTVLGWTGTLYVSAQVHRSSPPRRPVDLTGVQRTR